MKIIHVYKADCTGASRVLLQINWVETETIFLHRCASEEPVHVGKRCIESKKLSLFSLVELALKLRAENVKWIFHAQSSLIYLYALILLSQVVRRVATCIVYDIHDLNEKPDPPLSLRTIRSYIRYFVLAAAERGVARMKSVRLITVSNGLSKAFARRTGGPAPLVVHSASMPTLGVAELARLPRLDKVVVFFGTSQRIPFELVAPLADAGYELHLYGRGIDSQLVEKNISNRLWKSVKLFGPYRPDDLGFIGQYKYLVLYKPDIVYDNFRFSLPNKFFQGLAHGTRFIFSENFEEMREIVDAVPGLGVSIKKGQENSLGELLQDSASREVDFYYRVHKLSEELSSSARKTFRKAVCVPDV